MKSALKEGLKKRVVHAGFWSIIAYGATYCIRLSSSLIMTRLLVPELFGLMAIATMISAGLTMISDLGLKPSVVQNTRGAEASFLNTAWIIQISRAGLLCFAMVGIGLSLRMLQSPAGGSVYSDPRLFWLICALSITSLITGFESTKLLQAGRDLNLRGVTIIEVSSQAIGFIGMIGWAAFDRSIWSLVAGAFCASISKTVLSHLALPGIRNKFVWDARAAKEIARFGKWIFLSSLIFFVASNGDRIILGGLIEPAALGAYSVAFLIYSSIDQLLGRLIADVSFPALSEVTRESRSNLRKSYYKFHGPIAAVAYFTAGFLWAAGGLITAALYDNRYQDAGWILEILAVSLLAQPFRVATQTFLALGLARTYFQLNSLRMVLLLVMLPVGFHLGGFRGAVWGIALSHFSSLPLIVFYGTRERLFLISKEVLPAPCVLVGLFLGESLVWLAQYFR